MESDAGWARFGTDRNRVALTIRTRVPTRESLNTGVTALPILCTCVNNARAVVWRGTRALFGDLPSGGPHYAGWSFCKVTSPREIAAPRSG